MQKETSITGNEIELHHVMMTEYILDDISLDVFAGRLKKNLRYMGMRICFAGLILRIIFLIQPDMLEMAT